MKKRLAVAVIVCFLLVATMTILGFSIQNDDMFFLSGIFLKDSQKQQSTQRGVLASFHGTDITQEMVDYQRNMNIIRDEQTAQEYNTDRQIIVKLVQGIILQEEAKRLGLSATKEQISTMVENVKISYTMPEGKEILDSYLKGAEMTFEEYLQMIEQTAPAMISKQNIKDWAGKQYCETHGIEYTNGNLPIEALKAQETFINDLFEKYKKDIIYYTDN